MVGSIWQQASSAVLNAVSAVGFWFAQLFNSVGGALAFIIAMFIAFLSLRAFIRPLIGSTPSAFHENRRLLSKAKGER